MQFASVVVSLNTGWCDASIVVVPLFPLPKPMGEKRLTAQVLSWPFHHRDVIPMTLARHLQAKRLRISEELIPQRCAVQTHQGGDITN